MFDSMDELQELYQQVILDHSKTPRNFRAMENPTCSADGHNPLCGDQVTVYADIQQDTVKDIAFQGKGCAICTASASMMTQFLKGKPTSQADSAFDAFHQMLTGKCEPDEVTDTLGKLAVFAGVRKYPIRVKCATLPWHTFKAGLERQTDPVTTE